MLFVNKKLVQKLDLINRIKLVYQLIKFDIDQIGEKYVNKLWNLILINTNFYLFFIFLYTRFL